VKARQFIRFGNKYGNKRQTIDGISFDSKREADYYLELKMQKKAKIIKDFERQVSVELRAWHPDKGFVKVGTHLVDFLVTMPDGTKEFREVKGFATDLWKYKMKITEANYPGIQYKVIR
jgi:hypothetical protein